MQSLADFMRSNKIVIILSYREIELGAEGFAAMALGICPLLILLKFLL